MTILHFYSVPEGNGISEFNSNAIQQIKYTSIEYCFNVEIIEDLTPDDLNKLKWIMSDPYKFGQNVKDETNLKVESKFDFIIEVGRKLNFSTPFSSNAVSICHSIGLNQVKRIEKSVRYLFRTSNLSDIELIKKKEILKEQLCDITSCCYKNPITTFDHGIKPESWYTVDVIKYGRKALEDINKQLGLSFDDWDLDFYTELFANKLNRNPTSVECFDLAQSNSEHSRHWFFKGILKIDNCNAPSSLFDMIKETQLYSNTNNIIKFCDNSSAIRGFTVNMLKPEESHQSSPFHVESVELHLIFTAETHNFPTAICPFSGAATGTGGRIRDIQGVGRGGNTIAGTVGYSVGNLLIPGYEQPWEEKSLTYVSSFAEPLRILIEGSNGCSVYGNKFGEPVICGFTRSFGMKTHRNERREYLKPILFSGGVGTLYNQFKQKLKPEKTMKVIKIGGPAYRIGVGGGSASSTRVQGDNKSDLDFNAVQREDPEMEQKLNRFVRACIEYKNYENPILSIHDQGAGGNGNVLKELVEPEGAVIFSKRFQLGDDSLSILELWGAEYQENNAILCWETDLPVIQAIGRREHCPVNVVGTVTGNGRVILTEDECNDEKFLQDEIPNKLYPVDLDLKLVLEDVPKKTFNLVSQPVCFRPLSLPLNLHLTDAINRVLRHPTVCSKRFLVNKVDRSVTGLVAQQQCVGPRHTPVADAAVTAISYFENCGIATSIGEQPIKGLINPGAGGRMTVAEALSNLVFAPISSLKDVKCSGNWMWPAKLPGEGVYLYETCKAMCSIMGYLGIAVDGGKDSLSMAARLDNSEEIVKSPGTLVISTYAPCLDIRKIVTPDLKTPSYGIKGVLLYIDISNGKCRMGGSILAQSYNQLGEDVPDIDEPQKLQQAFDLTQKLVKEGKVYAGHDVSDGGLLTCLLEMAFAGVCGLNISIPKSKPSINFLFSEECGWVLEIDQNDEAYVVDLFNNIGLTPIRIGSSGNIELVCINHGESTILCEKLSSLYFMWEITSYKIDELQCDQACAKSEFESLMKMSGPMYQCITMNPVPPIIYYTIKVAVLREEGLNGDREMVAALHMANFEVWDVTMQDLLEEKITLDRFRGIIFPGGFSYADVFGAAKGWAAVVLYNEKIKQQFDAFVKRPETFSFGVCNGCQFMSLIGWIGNTEITETFSSTPKVVLKGNESGRFESRFSTVKICQSPAIMLRGMENNTLGVWVAHGEGRFTYSSSEVKNKLLSKNCMAIRYVDENDEFTEKYPFNPNGSSDGVAGICSVDGRHLAMMPHPERCVKFWQWPYIPAEWKIAMESSNQPDKSFSPWFQMFVNAYNWCSDNILPINL